MWAKTGGDKGREKDKVMIHSIDNYNVEDKITVITDDNDGANDNDSSTPPAVHGTCGGRAV